MKPKAPSLRGLLKMHKINTRIRLVENYTRAPGYKVANKQLNTD